MTDDPDLATEPCVGCGADVPKIDGPTHGYMRASPGCWYLYGQITARAFGRPNVETYVDSYAAQHPGGAATDRRQRQSVSVYLIALCLSLEHRIPADLLVVVRGKLSRMVLPHTGLTDWPYLEPPATLGAVTTAAVCGAAGEATRESLLAAWPEAVWQAWARHHGMVEGWASPAVRAWR